MISKIVIASVLAASSVSGSAQEAMRSADGSTSQWLTMHQCTLAPVSNFTVTNTGSMPTGVLRIAGEITMSRIDLQVSGTPGGSPTITAFAINTKGTGANSGRMSSDHAINTKGTGVTSGRSINEIGISVKSKRMSSARSPIGVACVTSQLTGDAATQKVDYAVFRPSKSTSRAGAKSVGWTCSVSGSEEQPVFSVGLLVPTILGQAERVVFAANMATGNNRVSIIPRGAVQRGFEGWPCASKEPRKANYDLALMTKA